MAIYDLGNPYRCKEFKEKVNELYKKHAVVEVKKVNPTRTLAQNNYLHLLLGYFGLKTGYTLEEVKECIFKRMLNVDLFRAEMYCKEAECNVERWRGTNELNTAELTLAINRFKDWSSAVAGIILPDAEEHKHLLACRTELEQAKEYIVIPD